MDENFYILNFMHVISPLFGLVINATSQVLLCRYARGLGLLKSIFSGFCCGFILLVSVEIAYLFSTPDSIVHLFGLLCVSIITYCTLSYCYFHFINLGETARRIRILRELYDSESGLTMEEILNRYNAKNIIEKRMGRLLNNGQIICKEGKYFAGKSTVLLMNRVMVLMKLLVLGKKGEFD